MKLTGVGASLHASHDDPSGELPRHWHSWEIIAWFPYLIDARIRRAQVDKNIAELQGSHLPREIAWAENLAEYLAGRMLGCVEIEIRRPGEQFYAKWRVE